MISRTRFRAVRPRAAVAGIVSAGILVLSLGVAVPNSGASGSHSNSESAFCKTIFTFKETAPTGTSLSSYHAWAKEVLPLYEKLASEAPNAASKKVLTELVTILKDYESSASLSKLNAYEVANHAAFLKGTKSLATAIISCAKSL